MCIVENGREVIGIEIELTLGRVVELNLYENGMRITDLLHEYVS